MKKILSPWSKEIKKAMIDKDMDTNDIAAALQCTRQYVSAVINGGRYYQDGVIKISRLLNIEVPEEKNVTLARYKKD